MVPTRHLWHLMYAFTHKFHVHILQEHTVDTDRCVCLYASAPARHSDYRCTFAHVITFVGTARNRRHVAKPSCRTHRGSSLTTCRPPVCCRTRPSCRTNLIFDAVHSTQVHWWLGQTAGALVTWAIYTRDNSCCDQAWSQQELSLGINSPVDWGYNYHNKGSAIESR